jgi:hypothetical protein
MNTVDTVPCPPPARWEMEWDNLSSAEKRALIGLTVESDYRAFLKRHRKERFAKEAARPKCGKCGGRVEFRGYGWRAAGEKYRRYRCQACHKFGSEAPAAKRKKAKA